MVVAEPSMAGMHVLEAAWLWLLIPGGYTMRGLLGTEDVAAHRSEQLSDNEDTLLSLRR